jgi:MFS family permease
MPNNTRSLRAIFLVSFLFFAHLSVVMYINSTLLSSLVGTTYTPLIYVLGAAGSIVLLFALPHLVERLGLVKTASSIFGILALSLLLLGTTTASTFVIVFVIYTAFAGTMWYCNDLFVAHYSRTETVGHTRGLYLTINNTAIALMPAIAGILVAHYGFHSVYLIGAAVVCIAAIVLLISQKKFVDREYSTTSIATAWQTIRTVPALRRVLSVNFLLQFFYVWMTLFTPLYLYNVLHFNWQQIGIAFSCMLTAFVLLQYIIGRWADRIGEKKLLIAGFAIAAVSTFVFAVLKNTDHSIVRFAVALFATRIGICMVEVLAETYFFKQITDRDESIVSTYRMMYPLAYVIAPLTGWYIITISSYKILFMVLAGLLVVGMLYAIRLVDIRPKTT